VRTSWFSRKKFQDGSSSEAITVFFYILTYLFFPDYRIICHYVISATESVIVYTITELMKKNISCLLLVPTCKKAQLCYRDTIIATCKISIYMLH